MNRSLLVENRILRNRVYKLEKENAALRDQCSQACHESLIEELRKKYQIPRWLLSLRSYECLEKKSFREVESYMQDRARMMKGNKPKLVSKEVI